MRTFTNGIIWWSQERWAGDRFASDVVMICKHLRATFRALCLELLPLWVWAGEPGTEPAPEPIPKTAEEWEVEVKILDPLAPIPHRIPTSNMGGKRDL